MISRAVVVLLWLWAIQYLSGVGALEASSQALSVANIPTCGLNCLLRAVPNSGCGFGDVACICQNHNLIQAASACMVSNCTRHDNLATARVNKVLCHLSDESKSHEVIMYSTVVYAFAFTCVALRIAGKIVLDRLAWNDVPVVVAIFLAAVPIAVVLAMCKLGFGEHLWNLNEDTLSPILRYFYIARTLYVVILGLIKVSLILLYLEIFPTNRFGTISWYVLGYIVVNALIVLFLIIFACTPVQAFWNRDLLLGSATCMDLQIISYFHSVSSIVQDLVLIALPMFFIQNLQMKRHRKVAVVAMFALGSFGCITTIIRLHTLIKFKLSFDPAWDYVSIVIWTELEITASFLCVSLPSIRVLVMHWIPNTLTNHLPSMKQVFHHKTRRTSLLDTNEQSNPTSCTLISSNQDHDTPPPRKLTKPPPRNAMVPITCKPKNPPPPKSIGTCRKPPHAMTGPPFHELEEMQIPRSRYSKKKPALLEHNKSRKKIRLYKGTDITALPGMSVCLPERTYSKERGREGGREVSCNHDV